MIHLIYLQTKIILIIVIGEVSDSFAKLILSSVQGIIEF